MADELGGMDEEGLRRTLGELLAANRATQANLDKLSQQFPIQPENLADAIPNWEELEEGGLEPPVEEDFAEQLGIGGGGGLDVLWVRVGFPDKEGNPTIEAGGEGFEIEREGEGEYLIVQTAEDFEWPATLWSLAVVGRSGGGVVGNVSAIEFGGGGSGGFGYRITLRRVDNDELVESGFMFFAANLAA